MKKEFSLVILSLILISVFSFIAIAVDEATIVPGSEPLLPVLPSGASEAVGTIGVGISSGFSNFLTSSLGPLFGNKEVLTKIFFAILLFMIINQLVGTLFKGKFVGPLASVIITILAIFFLPAEFITSLRTTYQGMGVAFLTLVPFAIMLLFTARVQSALVARLVWIFFAVYYLCLAFYQIFTTGWNTSLVAYIGAAIIGLVVFFAIGPIRNLLFKGEISSLKENALRDLTFREAGKSVERSEAKAVLGKNYP